MRPVRENLAAVLFATLALPCFSAHAQAAHHEDPPAQASASKPPAARPAPAPLDFSGVWLFRTQLDTFSAAEPPMQPWADEKYKSARPGYGPHASADSQDPIQGCLPPGMPRILLTPFPLQIIQTSDEIFMLFEYNHTIRQIYMNRSTHPKNLTPSWMGDSFGKWVGNTLVIDTVGLTDRSWLDQVGHPHSDALHIVERIRRTERDTLEDELTFDDPKAYTKSWTGKQVFKLKPGWHILEYVCEDYMAGTGH